jgi:HSP20 family protein
MSLMRRDPFREMLTLREAMNRLFEESLVWPTRTWPSSAAAGLAIAVDMHETEDDVVITADLPGLKPEDVDISITENALSMKGEFRSEEEGERGDVHFRERRYGAFQRSIALPDAIDADGAQAEFEDGVLTVTLPKTEETKPRRIEVKAKS